MKKIFSNSRNVAVMVLVLLVSSGILYSFSGGITGRTNKGPEPGCTCHNPSPSTSVNVLISGPDSVVQGTTVNYTVTITGGPLVRAGTDIAAGTGTLNTLDGSLQKIVGELTHTSPKAPSGGNVSFQFSYTAPNAPGTDILYANGNSVNFNGSNSGDLWNFAPNKTVIIKSPTGIINNSTTAKEFALSQNYPNPFNPVTNIKFSIPKTEDVKLTVFDVNGRQVAKLVDQKMNEGTYTVDFDASAMTSGVYFYTIKTSSFTETKTMMLIK